MEEKVLLEKHAETQYLEEDEYAQAEAEYKKAKERLERLERRKAETALFPVRLGILNKLAGAVAQTIEDYKNDVQDFESVERSLMQAFYMAFPKAKNSMNSSRWSVFDTKVLYQRILDNQGKLTVREGFKGEPAAKRAIIKGIKAGEVFRDKDTRKLSLTEKGEQFIIET